MIAPRSAFIDICGSRRHLLAWGDAAAPPVLMVHGLLDHAHNWDWIAAGLSDRYHVVAIDLRGHGDSDWTGPGSYALSNHVLDLGDCVHALDLPALHLVGQSLGGHIALRFAAAFPEQVRSFCSIEGIELPIVRDQAKAPKSYPVRLRQWIDGQRRNRQRTPRTYVSFAEASARMAEHNPGVDAETIAHLAFHGIIRNADGGWRWKYDHACRNRAPEDAHGVDLDEILAAIACPTLLAYGAESWIPEPSADRLARIADHRLVRFPGASHWLHHQSRAAFLTALTEFLDTIN
jgi:pimeloyl-ACP methyl ester carboxylesterase